MGAVWRFAERLLDAARQRWWQAAGRALLDARGVRSGDRVRLYGLPIVSRSPGSRIELGAGVVLCSHPRYTALGVARPVVMRTLRPEAVIRVGADTGLSGTVLCAAVSIDIGAQCLFGADVQITDTDFHPVAAAGRRFVNDWRLIAGAPVTIEDNVFLGAGVRVLKGVRIGRNTVVGAGSVVARSLPPDVVAAGVPARVIGPLPEAPLPQDAPRG